MVEAYIGAIFVDSEFNFPEVERFFDEHVRWFFEDMSIYDTFANNHPTVRPLICKTNVKIPANRHSSRPTFTTL